MILENNISILGDLSCMCSFFIMHMLTVRNGSYTNERRNEKSFLILPLAFVLLNHEILFLFVLLLYVPKSTAMVMVGWSVHLTTLFPGQA